MKFEMRHQAASRPQTRVTHESHARAQLVKRIARHTNFKDLVCTIATHCDVITAMDFKVGLPAPLPSSCCSFTACLLLLACCYSCGLAYISMALYLYRRVCTSRSTKCIWVCLYLRYVFPA